MADVIEQFDRLLSPCKDIHALFNFTALKQLTGNETDPLLPALSGNLTLCLNRLPPTTVDPSPTTSALPMFYVLIVYLATIAIVGLALNLCVIGTIWRVRRLRSVTNAFVLSLAMGDFFMASVLVPIYISEKYHPSQSGISAARDTLLLLLGVASLLNLAAATLERFMSIFYPLTYDAYLTSFRAAIIITAIWLVSFLQAFLAFAFPKHQGLYSVISFAPFVVPFLCILIVYIKIYFVARRHAWQIKAANPQGPNRAFISKLKTVRTIALLVGTFMVTWLPYFVVSIYEHHAGEELYAIQYNTIQWFPSRLPWKLQQRWCVQQPC